VSCHLCDVAKMTVIPAEAGIQKPEVARNTGFPLPASAGTSFVEMTSA